MPLDTNIIMGYQAPQIESPVNQLAKVLQIQSAQQANQLNGLKMDEYNRVVERQNKLRQVLGGLGADATDDQRVSALRGGGFFDEADKVSKGVIERQNADSQSLERKAAADKSAIETAHKKADLAGQVFGYVRQNPTPENAIAAIEHLTNLGLYTTEQAQGHIAKIQANPQNVAQMADLAYRGALSAKDQLPKLQALNAGGYFSNESVDPVTGQVTQTGKTFITQSEDNKATNATSRANNAASVAATLRGQDLVDRRAGENLAFEKTKEANKAGNDKALTEGQSKALLFGSRMQNAHEVLAELAQKGVNTSNFGANTGYGVSGVVNAMSGADQQRLEQAKRDFVNAVLRRESGASISEGEFDSANKQYFPQIGDSKQVIAQKAKAREIAIRGMQAEIPENRRDGLVKGVLGGKNTGGASGDFGGAAKGGFKYLGTE